MTKQKVIGWINYPYTDIELIRIAQHQKLQKKEIDELIEANYAKTSRVANNYVSFKSNERDLIANYLLNNRLDLHITVKTADYYDRQKIDESNYIMQLVYSKHIKHAKPNKVHNAVIKAMSEYFSADDFVILKITIDYDYSKLC